MLKEVAKVLKVGEMKEDYPTRIERERKEILKARKVHGKFMEEVIEVADGM